MILTRIYPGQPESIDLDSPEARSVLVGLYRPEAISSVRINLIGSVTGDAAGSDGTSHSLSSPADRTILGVIRELADVVLVGAASVRTEGYVMPRRAPLAIVTMSGDLTGHAIDQAAEGRLIVLCPREAVDRVRADLAPVEPQIIVLDAPGGRLAPADIVTALRVRGMESIVCEGGPALAESFLGADLVDEVCLTTSPVLGGRSPSLSAGVLADIPVILTQLLVDESSALYARWSVVTDPPPAAPITNG